MTQQVHDDAFHEIQLNGKQLVFLFMAATVVSVVIFLCGVLVGRGVRSVRGGIADSSPLSTVTETVPQQPAPAPASPPAGSDPRAAAPPPAAEDLSYFSRLEKRSAAAEQLKPEAAKPEPVKPQPAKPEPVKAAPESTRAAATAAHLPPATPVKEPASSPAVPTTGNSAAEPTGPGFAVQIAALNVRSEADAIARRLSSKGYAAYVLSPANGTPAVYRVRVGKFPTRREADTIAAKLQKEEQFKPWVTR